ncbi:uncharacterized protein [Pyxicephalus adspersus]|uniref:uncharacterized protein n=1 Tax=Pyxicephalus adspersus TaxID=30357 RepID=UPI003B5C8046
MCSSLLHQHCDGQFGSFINPDVCKTLHSTLDRQTQKKKCSTKDLSTPENIKFIPNSKRDIIQQSPEFVCDKDNRLKFSTTPIHVHGHPLQWILTTDMYSDWQKKLLKDEQQQMAEERSVETTLERSKDNFSKKTECHAGLPNSISEYTRKPWDSAKSSSSPSAKHDNTKKGSQLAAKKRKKPKEKSVVESTPNDIITEQNKEGVLLKEQAISKADSNKMKLSLKLSNAPESLMGIGVNDQTSKCKTVENCDTGRIFSEHEINTIESSEAESVCEEAKGHPDPKSLCLAGHLDQHKKKKDTRFLTTFIKKSLGEFIESSEEDNVLLKGFNEVPENENLSRCSTSEDQNSLASIPSDDRSSAKEKSPAIEEQSLFRETVHHNLSLCASNSFVIKKDKMNGVINLGISEQASESSDESQIDVIKGDDGNIGMLIGQSSLPSPSPSENNNNGDIYGEVRESEKFREMLIEEIEKSSSEEDKESEEKSEAKSSVNEKACIFTVRERKTQGQVNIPEQSETEESGSSREDEQSVNDSQGTGMVIMDAVIHGDNKEEQGNTEDDGKCYLNKKKEDQTKCNTKKSITSEDEMSEKANISDEETLSSEDLDASDQMDSSEEEENTDFWGSGHEDIDEIEKDVELQSSSSEDSTKQVNVSAR